MQYKIDHELEVLKNKVKGNNTVNEDSTKHSAAKKDDA